MARAPPALAAHRPQTPWACAMKDPACARTASEGAARAGLASVPDAIAEPIRCRYDEILTQALAWLPGDARRARRAPATELRNWIRTYAEDDTSAEVSLLVAS